MNEALIDAAKSGDAAAFARLVEPLRRELRAYCYRMSGSMHDADELLQETLVKAWKGLERFESRASVRTWMYRIATNVCLDALAARSPRTLPAALGPPVASVDDHGPPDIERIWIEPCPADLYAAPEASPESRYDRRETVALAFMVALQLLPPKQRAVLILRDVLGLEASECAEALDISVAAVKSALQRARETIDAQPRSAPEAGRALDDDTRALLSRYVEAWERGDPAALIALLREEASLAMPPFREWLKGAASVMHAIDTKLFKGVARAGIKMLPTEANGQPAFAVYFRDPDSGAFHAKGVQLVDVRAGRIACIVHFHEGPLVRFFGFEERL